MSKVFHDLPEAIDNTNEIVDKVELLNLKRDILLALFPGAKRILHHRMNTSNISPGKEPKQRYNEINSGN